ncbi:peptidoglycan recognition protein [Streptomyces sp. NBC_00820]|uniref:peptidoglycan recognition protein family protein n=1 Tax=Streptomyces sp. NBC_00820 TaxID=2975842 RepID=UPI002ED10C38|nr:peptidoglycan recognition protein [Streptomyces sp. NBC_00820]
MRVFLSSPTGASSIGVVCAAVLALPAAVPASAAAARTERPAAAGRGGAVAGSTQSLPLAPRSRDRALGGAPEQGLYRAHVRNFALVGVVWDDPDIELRGRVQVRTRSVATGRWSAWQAVETREEEHGADPGTAERASGRVRGATAPLWVGKSDGVDVRVTAGAAGAGKTGTAGKAGGRDTGPYWPLPAGLRLELVDPGDETPPWGRPADVPRTGPGTDTTDATDATDTTDTTGVADATNALDVTSATDATVAAYAANTDLAPFGATEIPELDRGATEQELIRLTGEVPSGKPYIGPRPRIVTRRGWGADESLRERGFVYTKKVKAAFVHHTASGNKYTCAQAPSVIRGIYRYHVKSMGWRDIGYNFLVDKCGTIYEGRAGGAAKAVLGAHTLGFNTNSMGIAVIGAYGSTKPSGAAVTAIARLTAWKLGLSGADPRAKTYLTSGGGNLYPKGKSVRLNVISGHRDGYATDCPGKRLYTRLGTARSSAAKYQGR